MNAFVPFPFIIACVFIFLLTMASWLKDWARSKIMANFLALCGLMEPVLLICLIISSIIIKSYIAFVIFMLCFFTLLILNITVFVLYIKWTFKDHDFQIWASWFKFTSRVIPVVGLIWHFRILKFLYSGFFGLEMSLMNLTTPRQSFFRFYNIV